MTPDPRVVLAVTAVTLFGVVNLTALALGSGEAGAMLLLCALLAVLAAVQCAAWDPALLTWALAFSLPPVISLGGGGWQAWLVGPLGALLLLAAELNSLSWEYHGPTPNPATVRRRLVRITMITALGLLAAVGVAATALVTSPAGLPAVLLGAAALTGLGWLLFGRGTHLA